ncbi:hypothetical protein GE21DRAFT_9787 [Neurospora crassa]|uniref:Uncharacterized protein n=1 Tax=Neurospora crassa (strain ATCC 24698 / 74-OR23-1A / CBS 708.71 / DSM 1257 / FGSC 987) TaxID=367110 RepID=Q7S3G8_NEUCR|nr:hypothetical protein NCU06885 [Neurospora crassa OR74A]EAA29996.1 hypothetical protein NCU06885 [Neurospora crassa OR74A]KHE82558.1 hypothetical protein GE21DRAFT_9787 [Neurospora crassa]|eukprot:XP_959232.1 hypothetical protein NCU06885 [Neurospora crassa OR74A]
MQRWTFPSFRLSVESQSAYLRRLKALEKEIDQLRKEGRELTRREHEIKLVVERDEKEVEGVMMEDHHAEEDGGGGWDGGGGGGGDDGDNGHEATWERTSDEGTFRKESVEREEEAKDLKEEREGRVRVWQLKVEEESLDGNKDEDEDNREVKQEAEDVANDSFE